jgi:uncharacterized protein YgbK (DUF1537 family)
LLALNATAAAGLFDLKLAQTIEQHIERDISLCSRQSCTYTIVDARAERDVFSFSQVAGHGELIGIRKLRGSRFAAARSEYTSEPRCGVRASTLEDRLRLQKTPASEVA